jgi:prepilin-type N-terminal cleavage/methylation domain-containing protein
VNDEQFIWLRFSIEYYIYRFMFHLEPSAKKGFTLIEVMIAALMVCVIAAGFATALSLAARQRMDARIRTAALVEANSSAEFVMAAANSVQVPKGHAGFLKIDPDEGVLSLTLESSDPHLQWDFDGQSYREQITATNNNNILYFQVSVFCNPTRPVTVRSEAYLKP